MKRLKASVCLKWGITTFVAIENPKHTDTTRCEYKNHVRKKQDQKQKSWIILFVLKQQRKLHRREGSICRSVTNKLKARDEERAFLKLFIKTISAVYLFPLNICVLQRLAIVLTRNQFKLYKKYYELPIHLKKKDKNSLYTCNKLVIGLFIWNILRFIGTFNKLFCSSHSSNIVVGWTI